MVTMNISLPAGLKAVAEARAKSNLYANVSDYVRDLIRRDLAIHGDWEIDEELGAALDAGEASGWSDKTVAEIVAEERAKFRSV